MTLAHVAQHPADHADRVFIVHSAILFPSRRAARLTGQMSGASALIEVRQHGVISLWSPLAKPGPRR